MIPVMAWVGATVGYYLRDIFGPLPQAGGHAPPQQYPQAPPPPQYHQQQPPPYYAQPPMQQPPRRRHSPVPLDPHMDERTDAAIARALVAGDPRTLRGFAQSIAQVYPIGAGALRTRAFLLEQMAAQQAQAQQQVAPPPQAPVPVGHVGGPPVAPPVAAAAGQKGPTQEQVDNYQQLLADMAGQGGIPAQVAAQAPPPPPAAPVVAPPPTQQVQVQSVIPPHANGVAVPAAPPPNAAPPAAPVAG